MSGTSMGWRTPAAICGIAALAATLILAVPAEATFPTGSNGRIAYVANDGGDSDVFTMNPDGSAKTNLTLASTVGDFQPTFSPNGMKIVFARSGQGILVMNADGSGAIQIAQSNSIELPSFSPDGKKIVYTQRTIGADDVYVMNADGSDKVDLTTDNSTGRDQQSSFSPDGKRIAYQRCDPDCHIATMNPDGSGDANVTLGDSSHFDGAPYYSPDGQRIAFVRCDVPKTRCDTAIVPTSGGVPDVITDTLPSAWNVHPAWSPDGTRIAITSGTNVAVQQDIVLINPDGSNPVPLTTTDNGIEPDWESVHSCRGKRAGIVGTLGNDTLLGTAGPDVFFAFDGRDQVNGRGGKDVICGGDGGGKLSGGGGKDTVVGGAGRDKEIGGKGNDLLLGKQGRDVLNGGGDEDKCKGGAGRDKASKCEAGKA